MQQLFSLWIFGGRCNIPGPILLLKRRSRSHYCSLVVMDPRWKHPFTCIVAGPMGCGKTTFVARLLRNASVMIDPPPEQVMWYCGQWQSAYENLDIPKLRLEEGLPKSFDTGKRNVVVLDDLMAETDGRVTQLFTKKSHHSCITFSRITRRVEP